MNKQSYSAILRCSSWLTFEFHSQWKSCLSLSFLTDILSFTQSWLIFVFPLTVLWFWVALSPFIKSKILSFSRLLLTPLNFVNICFLELLWLLVTRQLLPWVWPLCFKIKGTLSFSRSWLIRVLRSSISYWRDWTVSWWWESSATPPTALKRTRFYTGNDDILKLLLSHVDWKKLWWESSATPPTTSKKQNFKQATTTFLRLLLSHLEWMNTRGGNPPPRRPQPQKERNFKQSTTTF